MSCICSSRRLPDLDPRVRVPYLYTAVEDGKVHSMPNVAQGASGETYAEVVARLARWTEEDNRHSRAAGQDVVITREVL